MQELYLKFNFLPSKSLKIITKKKTTYNKISVLAQYYWDITELEKISLSYSERCFNISILMSKIFDFVYYIFLDIMLRK
jgi:hypothetical protein